jgi:hypothetical protein
MGATWLPIDFNAAYIPGKATRVAHMNGESVERLMEIILQMKINLSHINETLHQQTYEIREQLGLVFVDEKRALERCLNSIDDKLKECSIHADEYQRLYSSLATMREKLVQLGAEPSALLTVMPVTNVEGIIAWRLRELSQLGKF